MAEANALAAAIADTAEALSPPARATLLDHLRKGSPAHLIRGAVPATAYQVAIDRLLVAWGAEPEVSGSSLALAIEAVVAGHRGAPRLSLVWTGPTTSAVPVRRTDQALLQLINRATTRLIIVSFAVYKVPNVAATLEKAARRGVVVDLVVETEGGERREDRVRRVAETRPRRPTHLPSVDLGP